MTDDYPIDPPPAAAASLRHDLLTPVNHIIGYGQLLQEELKDSEQPDILAGLREIVGLGRDVFGVINRMLPTSGCAAADSRQLQANLTVLLARVVSLSERLQELAKSAGFDAYSTDLERLAASANRLAEIVHVRLGKS
jgi:signal transduction histidine kinase